jgi:predicted nucleotidyltransferase
MIKTDVTILKRIKEIILQNDPSAKIFLYGSRARGTARSDSDWDLLILLNRERITCEMEHNITDPLYELEFETGEVISPMVYSSEEWESKYRVTPLYSNIMREGKLL